MPQVTQLQSGSQNSESWSSDSRVLLLTTWPSNPLSQLCTFVFMESLQMQTPHTAVKPLLTRIIPIPATALKWWLLPSPFQVGHLGSQLNDSPKAPAGHVAEPEHDSGPSASTVAMLSTPLPPRSTSQSYHLLLRTRARTLRTSRLPPELVLAAVTRGGGITAPITERGREPRGSPSPRA